MRRILGFLLFVGASGCARPLPPAFVKELEAAKSTYARSEYRNAARHFQNAARLAPNARERDEADYLRAASLARAGDLALADRVYASLERGTGARAERAAFARAELLLAQGGEDAGFSSLRKAMLKYPGSGLSERAAQLWLSHLKEKSGLSAAYEECVRLLAAARSTELEPRLLLERARLLEALGKQETARDAYLELAQRFAYPSAYWDEALDRAARIDEGLGRYTSAIGHLERMLRERESAALAGSYERPLYAAARFHIAEIHRDRLKDPKQARQQFRRVFVDHPTSELRDDALFEEALIALGRSDAKGACEAALLLRNQQPDSRYARCARVLCPTLAGQPTGCRTYVLNRISAAKSSSE